MSFYDAFPCSGGYRPTSYGSQTPYYTQSTMPSLSSVTGLPTLPTGMPTGPASGPMPTSPPATPPPVTTGVGGTLAPQTVQSTQYIPGYLSTQIGKRVRVEFLIGSTGPLVDRVGTLLGVGASYILINPENTDDVLLCDLYSIKFVTFYR